MKKQILSLAFLAATTIPAFAGGAAFWTPSERTGEKSRIEAESYLTYQLRFADMANALRKATQNPQGAVAISLPVPDGSNKTFLVWETPISTGDFYQKYPDLLTYTGTQKDNPAVTVKIDVGEGAFHAMILDGTAQYFIDPFSLANDGSYIVYDRKAMNPDAREKMRCELDAVAKAVPDPAPNPAALLTNGAVKHTYRLALACTGEYARAATGLSNPTKVQVLAKMITTMNRVNGIYETELAATMQLVPNTDTLIFTNGATDPYTNSNSSAMLGENQAVVDARIGSGNYDIGHVFSTGGGGVAALGSLCNNSTKARGVTGSSSPVGDPFDVDFVAHEMGHQFGAQHTFNAGTGGSCGGGNRSGSSAYEPGSGSTIMAYAGICGSSDNLQRNSDAYFHFKSLDQTTTRISQVPTCGTSTNTGNPIPAIAQAPATYNIPWYTPFELTAPTVSGTGVTYSWEQDDLGSASSYNTADTAGPVWRSNTPTSSPTRVFPAMSRLLLNLPGLIGDRLPTVGRTTTFRLTVRDVRNGTGAFAISNSDLVKVQSIKAADTFKITNLLLSTDTLIGGGQKTITWNVSNSTAAPINCNAVDIYYSVDGGQTFPYTLASNVPNTGSATVTIPNITTVNGRIKLKASNSIFFVINRALLRTEFDPSSIHNVSGAEKLVKVYPVPAKDVVKLEIPGNLSSVNAVLYNNMGQQVWKGRFESGVNIFPVAALPVGAYYFRLQNVEQGFAETTSFVVQ